MHLKPQNFMTILENSGIVPEISKLLDKGKTNAFYDIGNREVRMLNLPGTAGGKVASRYSDNIITFLKSIDDLGYTIQRGIDSSKAKSGIIKPVNNAVRLDYNAMRNIKAAADQYF